MDTSTITTVVSLGWDSLLKLMGSVVLSLGGGAAVALFIFHFMADRLAERLKGKYQLELDEKFESYKADINKKLESHKTELGTKQYITQKKFDFEFQVYQSLSEKFFDLVAGVNGIINKCEKRLADEDKQNERENKNYQSCVDKFILAQNELRKNAPFIQENIYKEYLEILKLSEMQFDAFERRWNVGYLVPASEKKKFTIEEYDRSEEIINRLDETNKLIREYINRVIVI